jgi:hypothetical protein
MVGKMHGFCVDLDEPKIVKNIIKLSFMHTMKIYLPLRNGTMKKNTFKTRKFEDHIEEKIDEVEENFDEVDDKIVKRMKKVSDKYKGKLPFKYFSCGEIGHCDSRCPKRHKKNKHRKGK